MARRNIIHGRSRSAPARTIWPGDDLNDAVRHVKDLTDRNWTNSGARDVCLAYKGLDTRRLGQTEGLIIDCPKAVNDDTAVAHFQKVKEKLQAAQKNTDVTEATGEAAAALTMLSRNTFTSARGGSLTLAGFQMAWGMKEHSGPGFDQIWIRALRSGRTVTTQYLIVEAKGVGATLNTNSWMPDDFEQMGTRWVCHNLKMMESAGHDLGDEIIKGLKLDLHIRWGNFDGASKNYYGCRGYVGSRTAPPDNVQLYGVVITANWQPDGMLKGKVSGFRRYTNFTY
ncbi:hypothetical protein SAMN05444370_1387 [Rubrimonas cliftonensis]|uniref:Uncharacterized protein n=2 Tax=Rubrimonas cliftonensis TaxID=89524 RepID=A0A1H4G588_9RHOB|nr:hypothetical protein SAMN05444370_1387 [Rubrimonas cliftonensis]